MEKVEFSLYDKAMDEKLKYAVIAAQYNGKWVLCKHKQRDTYEIPGGHREAGEAIADTAKRELYEETGAAEFDLVPICVYKVDEYGMLYWANIHTLGALPDFEMEQVSFFDDLPENLTYPQIQPYLFRKARDFIKGR